VQHTGSSIDPDIRALLFAFAKDVTNVTLRLWSRIAAAVGLFVAVQSAVPAGAAWSAFTSIGTSNVFSDPSCAADGNGTAVCAALGSGSTPIVARFNGTSWSGWTHLSGVITAAPSCAAVLTGEVICASRNTDLQLIAYLWNGKTWSASLAVATGLDSAPSCAALSGGKAVCAGRSYEDGIVSAVYSGKSWAASSWSNPAVVVDAVYGPVECTPDDVGDAICAYLSLGSTTKVREFTTAWSTAINIAGFATKPATCTDAGVGGKAACFTTSTDGALYGQQFLGGTFTAAHWTGWGSIGGSINTFSCAQDGQKAALVNYACGAVALTNDAFYTNEFNGSGWSGWEQVGTTTFIGSPSCFALNTTTKPGRIMCAATTVSNIAVTTTGP